MLVSDGTPLAKVGYPLDTSSMVRGFVEENVCFMTGDIDEKDLLAF